MSGIADAVREAGGAAVLAEKLGIRRQSVYEWIERGYAPAERVVEINALTGVSVLEMINPKLVHLVTPAKGE
jgi:DNA-binding transcriptional regulator YdaS (Cro superfamily)